MSYWFHRNPLKATSVVSFDIKMFAHDPEALKILGDLKQSRKRFLDLLPDPNHTADQVSTALKLYLTLARGLLLQPGEGVAASKLCKSITFRWNDSILEGVSVREDAVYEVSSIIVNCAFWFMKRAVLVAVKPEISMEDAKEVHTSLRKAAGLIKFVQCTAEAQEVTIARAIELKHNPSLISSLANETSRNINTPKVHPTLIL